MHLKSVLCLVAVNQTTLLACLFAFDTYLWQPGRATTYVLPVIEIEDIILRLTRTRDDLVSNDKNPIIVKLSGDASVTIQQLNKLLGNWNTVLSNYRAHNKDMNTAFDQEQRIVSALLSTYQTWQTSIVSNSDLDRFAYNELTPTNPISIVMGLLSGDSTGISKDLSSSSAKFSELSSETRSLSDGLAKLSHTVSSSSTRRQLVDLSPPQSLADALIILSNNFYAFADKSTVIASRFSNLATNPLLKTLASIIQLVFKDLSTRFDAIFNDIVKKYVQPLIDKVKAFSTAAQASLASFQSKVGDYLDNFLAALSAIDLCSQALADLFNDMSSHTSGALSNILSDTATTFQDIREVESTIAYFLNFLTQFFPTPTSILKLSLGSISGQLTTLSASATGFQNSVVTVITNVKDQIFIDSAQEFTGYLSKLSMYAQYLVPIFTTVEAHVSILSPLFKRGTNSTSSSASSSSLASSIAATLNKFYSVISKLSTQFTTLTTSATASLSSFISNMSAMYTSLANTVSIIVGNVASLVSLFQEIIVLASFIPDALNYLGPVRTNLKSFSDSITMIPGYLISLPRLLITSLAQFGSGGIFRSTLEITHEAFFNISKTASTLSSSSLSFSKLLPSPFSVALSPPFLLFSQTSGQLSKVSATLSTSLSSLIASSDFAVLSTVLSIIPSSSQQITEMLTNMNSYIVFFAEQLLAINLDFIFFASGVSSRRGRALTTASLLITIETTLESLFATFSDISSELLKVSESSMYTILVIVVLLLFVGI